jgi:hypothetical protein
MQASRMMLSPDVYCDNFVQLKSTDLCIAVFENTTVLAPFTMKHQHVFCTTMLGAVMFVAGLALLLGFL